MLIFGLDISKTRLDLARVDGHTTTTASFANDADGIAALVAEAQQRQPAWLALEATGAYHYPVLAALLVAALPATLLNPAQIAAYRQVRLDRNKTDRQDARLIARFAYHHADQLRPARPTHPTQQALRELVGYRESCVSQRTKLRNRLEAAEWRGSDAARDLGEAQLALVEVQLAELERRLRQLLRTLPEAAVVLALPGVGVHTTAAVLAALPPELWGQAKPAAAYLGVQPCQRQSGASSHSQLSKAGPARVRRVLYWAAQSAKRCDPAMRARFERHVAQGLSKQAAVCALMHTLVRQMMGRLKRYYREQHCQPSWLMT
jgi:transposase